MALWSCIIASWWCWVLPQAGKQEVDYEDFSSYRDLWNSETDRNSSLLSQGRGRHCKQPTLRLVYQVSAHKGGLCGPELWFSVYSVAPVLQGGG